MYCIQYYIMYVYTVCTHTHTHDMYNFIYYLLYIAFLFSYITYQQCSYDTRPRYQTHVAKYMYYMYTRTELLYCRYLYMYVCMYVHQYHMQLVIVVSILNNSRAFIGCVCTHMFTCSLFFTNDGMDWPLVFFFLSDHSSSQFDFLSNQGYWQQ